MLSLRVGSAPKNDQSNTENITYSSSLTGWSLERKRELYLSVIYIEYHSLSYSVAQTMQIVTFQLLTARLHRSLEIRSLIDQDLLSYHDGWLKHHVIHLKCAHSQINKQKMIQSNLLMTLFDLDFEAMWLLSKERHQ